MGHDVWELPIAFLNKLLFYDSLQIGGRGLHKIAEGGGQMGGKMVHKSQPPCIWEPRRVYFLGTTSSEEKLGKTNLSNTYMLCVHRHWPVGT